MNITYSVNAILKCRDDDNNLWKWYNIRELF